MVSTVALPAAARSSSRTSWPTNNPKTIFFVVALLTSLPRSSTADASSLIAQTCRRTPHAILCISVLQASKGGSAARTVQDLAVAALDAARRATIRATLRAKELIDTTRAAGKGTVLVELLARCDEAYSECLRTGAWLNGGVATGQYDGVAADAAALRRFPRRCEALFAARGVASPLRQENREIVDKLAVALDIVSLLR